MIRAWTLRLLDPVLATGPEVYLSTLTVLLAVPLGSLFLLKRTRGRLPF